MIYLIYHFAGCCLWQALKVLRTAEYAPFVVFVAAPTIATFTEVFHLFVNMLAGALGCASII